MCGHFLQGGSPLHRMREALTCERVTRARGQLRPHQPGSWNPGLHQPDSDGGVPGPDGQGKGKCHGGEQGPGEVNHKHAVCYSEFSFFFFFTFSFFADRKVY